MIVDDSNTGISGESNVSEAKFIYRLQSLIGESIQRMTSLSASSKVFSPL